jgi:membrane-bound acyltransferase YfiQ involved in biofilm formation
MRNLPVLRGLAIFAVICHHAAGWGFTALIWASWNRGTNSSYNDLLGTPTYYALVAVQQLAVFSVPAFLFIAGFFAAYAARAGSSNERWKALRTRVAKVLWPYLLWSAVFFAADLAQRSGYPLPDLLRKLATGGVVAAYFFVPLLVQFYLLSQPITAAARRRPGLLLALAASVQLAMFGLLYARIFGVPLPKPLRVVGGAGAWFGGWWALYFPLGTVCGFHINKIQPTLARYRLVLSAAVLILAAASVGEFEWLYRASQDEFLRSPAKLSSLLYSLAVMLLFLGTNRMSGRLARAADQLGGKSYGIYLLHPKAMELFARLAYHFAPALLPLQVVFQPMLITLAIALPLALMAALPVSPARRLYPYVFG